MNWQRATAIFDRYASGVAWVETSDGEQAERSLGTAFHVGDGLFATAAHVVAKGVERIGTTSESREVFRSELGVQRVDTAHEAGETTSFGEPMYHEDEGADLALLEVAGLDAAAIPLVDEEDEAGERLTLRPVLVMGYPRVPGAINPPPLLASLTEISGTATIYFGGPRTMLIGAMARGGFSGGPVLSSEGKVLGLMTRSLVTDDAQAELGFLNALRSEAILECAKQHGLDETRLKISSDENASDPNR